MVSAALLSLVVLAAGLLACDALMGSETYTAEEGFSITMSKGFYKKDMIAFTAYWESSYAIVTTLKENFSDLGALGIGASATLGEYMQVIITVNNYTGKEIQNSADGKFVYFTYEATVSGRDYFYLATAAKGSDSFWLTNFACETKNKDKYQEKFLSWAATIEVN